MSSVLKKKVNGQFVEIGASEKSVFRGEWEADTLATQFTFASGIPPQFTPEFSASGLAPLSSSVSTLGYSGTPGPFTGAAVLRAKDTNDSAYSQLNLDLSELGITNISRVSAWFAQGSAFGNPQDYFRQEIRVNNVTKAFTSKGVHAWVQISASATESDVVSFRHECDYGANLSDWNTQAGFTGVQIFNRTEPYMLGEFVTHTGQMWKSLIDNNGDTPGVSASWQLALTLPSPTGTTAERPSAATAGVGYMYFDSTLGKPIWSNGTAWTDSAGTVV